MEYKDYYAALGVAPDADDEAIKKAYRKLARQYHPDVNPGNQQAEAKFKEINEAYQALGDPESRKKYDALRRQYEQWQRGGGRGGFDWGPWQASPGQQTTVNISPEDLQDLFGGASPFSDFFSSMFGQGGSVGFGQATPGSRGARPGAPRRGRDHELIAEITLEEAFHGTTRAIQLGERQIETRIPPGVRTGSRVRLSGQGSPGAAGGAAGDLYLVIEVAPHAQFEREGDDLRVEVPVDIYTAASGGEAAVPALDGRVKLKIPPRTQAGKTFRLRGKGMPRLERPQERGDLYAQVKLVLPEALSDQELETLRRLGEQRQSRERGGR